MIKEDYSSIESTRAILWTNLIIGVENKNLINNGNTFLV